MDMTMITEFQFLKGTIKANHKKGTIFATSQRFNS